MATKSFTFDLGNRDLTTEELGVVKKARESFAASAARHGVRIDAGGVLIKVTSSGMATANVTRPRGTDVVRQAAQPEIKVETARDKAVQAPSAPRVGARKA